MNVLERFEDQFSGLDAALIGEPVSLSDGSEIALFKIEGPGYPAVATLLLKGQDAKHGISYLRHPEARVIRMGDGDFNRGVIAVAREVIERWESNRPN